MFRRALIGYSPSSVKVLLERMEQQHAQLLQECEALLERIENMNRELAEQVERIRSCVKGASERYSQIDRREEVIDRLLLACRDWCEREAARISEAEKGKELSLAKCDEDIAAKEALLENLRRLLTGQLARLVEEVKKGLNAVSQQRKLLVLPIPSRSQKAEQTTAPLHDEQSAAESSPLSRRIVIIDDDPAICSIVRLVMEREGYEVDELGDGRAAIDYIEKNPPCAMVIVDLMLPFVDGLQVVRKVRTTPGWQEVPVLVLSSNSSEREIIDLFQAGASEYMIKPFSTLELAARARRLLEKR